MNSLLNSIAGFFQWSYAIGAVLLALGGNLEGMFISALFSIIFFLIRKYMLGEE